jgi:hypothetical protein
MFLPLYTQGKGTEGSEIRVGGVGEGCCCPNREKVIATKTSFANCQSRGHLRVFFRTKRCNILYVDSEKRKK